MAANDPADTHGHTHADAALQEPTLDLGAAPASESFAAGEPLEADMVLAQSPAEVEAQIANLPGGSGS